MSLSHQRGKNTSPPPCSDFIRPPRAACPRQSRRERYQALEAMFQRIVGTLWGSEMTMVLVWETKTVIFLGC